MGRAVRWVTGGEAYLWESALGENTGDNISIGEDGNMRHRGCWAIEAAAMGWVLTSTDKSYHKHRHRR